MKVQPMSEQPLSALLTRHLTELTRAPRTPDSPSHSQARRYISSHLQAAGFQVEERRFKGPSVEGINLLTRPIPERDDLPLFIVGAHYDSVTDSPGADDNASGVAALVALAEEIQSRRGEENNWTCRLQLAAYDLEEYGILGSWTHTRQLRQSSVSVAGMIALEMLAYTDRRPGGQGLPPHLVGIYPDVGDFIGLCGNETSRSLVQHVESGMRSVGGLGVQSLVVPGTGEALGVVRLSDHSSFWDAGYPALMITDTSFFRNPHYHQPTDTIETLDMPFFVLVTRGLCEAVSRVLHA
jgi:Zn-dependent M28 family amino/carboxypeptidase